MNTEPTSKLFAFKLAEQKKDDSKENTRAPQWQVRDGVSVAGCTDEIEAGALRTSTRWGTDDDIWC